MFNVSRLPFGIGSHAEGIPFDNEIISVDDESTSMTQTLSFASELTLN